MLFLEILVDGGEIALGKSGFKESSASESITTYIYNDFVRLTQT